MEKELKRLTYFIATLYPMANMIRKAFVYLIMFTTILILSGIIYTLNYLSLNSATLMMTVASTYSLMIYGLLSIYKTKDCIKGKQRLLVFVASTFCILIGWIILEKLPWS